MVAHRFSLVSFLTAGVDFWMRFMKQTIYLLLLFFQCRVNCWNVVQPSSFPSTQKREGMNCVCAHLAFERFLMNDASRVREQRITTCAAFTTKTQRRPRHWRSVFQHLCATCCDSRLTANHMSCGNIGISPNRRWWTLILFLHLTWWMVDSFVSVEFYSSLYFSFQEAIFFLFVTHWLKIISTVIEGEEKSQEEHAQVALQTCNILMNHLPASKWLFWTSLK